MRQKVIEQLHAGVAASPEWMAQPEPIRIEIIQTITRSCTNLALEEGTRKLIKCLWDNLQFAEIYSIICFKVIYNFNASNTYLINRVISGQILPQNIPSMSSMELNPAASEAERNEIELRSTIQLNRKVSSMYTCKNCRGKQTYVHAYQGRSGDEPQTLSIQCVICESAWKMSA